MIRFSFWKGDCSSKGIVAEACDQQQFGFNSQIRDGRGLNGSIWRPWVYIANI